MQQIRNVVAGAADSSSVAGPEPVVPRVRTLTGEELRLAKRSYVTARFDLGDAAQLVTAGARPRPGDLLLARITRLGHHRKLESPDGRRQTLFADDLILVCYGARYASDQFEALVPDNLASCHLAAAGGIAGLCGPRHAATRKATEIEPLGLVADAGGRVLNLADYAERRVHGTARQPYILAVVGSAMNSGKTTTVASMIRGLARSGLCVGAAKVTGTGAGCDRWSMVDAGAELVLDFTDFGYASTYQVPVKETAAIFESAVAILGSECCDVVVVELADGLLFPETAALVEHAGFRDRLDGLLLAASDSMSARFGADWLLQRGLPLIGIAGKLTSSPLMVREVEASCSVPVVGLEALESGQWTRKAGRDGKQVAA